MISNIIVEGADQQGKTTLCNFLGGKLGWDIKHFGMPPDEFDFHSNYVLPACTISDRNFLSEIVYSYIRGENSRIKDLHELQLEMISRGYLMILADRREDFQFNDREEQYTEREIREARRLYRDQFKTVNLAKVVINVTTELYIINKILRHRYR